VGAGAGTAGQGRTMPVEVQRCQLFHPAFKAGIDARVWIGQCVDPSGEAIPCLRLTLSRQQLRRIASEPAPAQLRPRIERGGSGQRTLAIVAPGPGAPWLELPLGEAASAFVEAIDERGDPWVLELESRLLRIVWVFDPNGNSIPCKGVLVAYYETRLAEVGVRQ
jgi:hypothetical protein